MRPRAGVLACAALVGVAVALHRPGLGADPFADDYLQRAMLDGEYPVRRAPWDLYAFYGGARELPALVSSGTLPWWTPSELRLSLLRPLPSLLLWVEHRLGLSPFAQHLASLAWLVAFLVAHLGLARRLLPPPAALLAVALVAFDVALVSPVAWLCNRATLVTATFSALALWAYHRDLEAPSPRWARLSMLGFALAWLSGEYAVCTLALVVAQELVGATDAWVARLRRAARAFVPAALYALAHVAGGYGASGGAVYVSPLESPVLFVTGALIRVPSLLATELVLLPGEAVYVALAERSPLLVWAVVPLAVALAVVALGLRALPAPHRRRFAALGLGALLGLVPLAGTVPGVRLLLLPSLAGSLILAAAFWGILRRVRGAPRRVTSWLLALGAVPLAVLHLVVSPLVARAESSAHRERAASFTRAALESEIDDARVADQDLVLLNLPADLVAVNYAVRVRHHHGRPMPRSWRTLASALVPLAVTRISDDTLELATTRADQAFFNWDPRRGEPADRPFRVGQLIGVPGLDIEILEVRGWAPSRVRYRFPSSLDDPSRVFLRFERGRLVRFALPAVGATAPLPVGFP